ncbi:MAG TPA: transporter substrate-binding domain-containing protein, partial [Gaiellales bacterium]
MPEAIVTDLAPTGTLRAAINLGNPVLAQGSPSAPVGVTVDIARELAARVGVPLELHCFGAARDSYEAATAGRVDVCFLAIEPARAAEIAFTAPYVVIEGVFAVPQDSPITAVDDVDREGVRIGVNAGSAYDLFLSRTLERATIVRGDDGVGLFRQQGLEAVAGVRQPLARHVAADPELRLLPGRFMEIRQALAVRRDRDPDTVGYLHGFVEELKAGGFIAD